MHFLSQALCVSSAVCSAFFVPESQTSNKRQYQSKKKAITPHNSAFLDGELLYFRPNQTGMTYCLATTFNPDSLLGTKSKEIQQKSDWGPGFRIGTGFSFLQSKAALGVYWTRFHKTTHGSVSGPFLYAGELFGFNSTTVVGGSAIGAGKANSTWSLHLDQIELDLSYNLAFCHRLFLTPYLGIQGGWINQKQNIRYDNFFDLDTSLFVSASVKETNHFHGIGPKLGMRGEFCFGSGFGIMGHLATVLLYGQTHAPVHTQISNDPSFAIPNFTISYRQHQLIPVIQGQVELNWERQFTRRISLLFGVGYEVQFYWNTWRNQNSGLQNLFVSDAGYGDLSLQGVTGRVTLTF